ncbi:MAG: PAS domain S-box protein [Thainema sp.]
MKVLVVEDELGVAQSLQHLLSHYHYAVDIAADAETGLQMSEAFAYDLAILDIALPGMDGLSLCQRLREQGLEMPVLLLTGQNCKSSQKAAALNVGADDYVSKPFDTEELMARIQALLRRHSANVQPILSWGALSVDPGSRRVTYGVHLLSPTPKEYAILELLLRNSQMALSAADIIDRVWDSADAPGDEVVRYHIKELRQKLKAAGAPKAFIQTVHGVGYRVNPLFSDHLANQVEKQPSLPQVAELTSVNEQLRQTLEELQMTSEQLRVQNKELQATRRELEQERHRYQDLFEFAPDGYLVTDRSGRIQAANQAAVTMLGMAASELTNRPLENFIHPADRRSFCAYLKQHRWPQNWEVMIHAAQQDFVPVLISVTLMLDDQQQVTGLRWLLRDIRDRKRMEQQLQAARDELEQRVIERTATLHQREAFLSSIYHGAAQPIFVVDVTAAGNFHYVDFNRAALEISGLSLEEIQNQTPEAVFGDSIGGDFRQNYQRCVDAGSSLTYEERFTLDQHDVWTITTLSPIRDQGGQIHRLVGTVFDISDRKRAEEALQHSEAQARLAIQVGQLGTWQYDPRTEWVVLDERMREIWGESAETTTLPLSTMMERIHPDDREQVAIAIQSALDPASSGQYAVECRIVWADGTEHWILANGLVQFQGEGAARQPYSFFGTILDVTDRKQSERIPKQQIRRAYRLSDIA